MIGADPRPDLPVPRERPAHERTARFARLLGARGARWEEFSNLERAFVRVLRIGVTPSGIHARASAALVTPRHRPPSIALIGDRVDPLRGVSMPPPRLVHPRADEDGALARAQTDIVSIKVDLRAVHDRDRADQLRTPFALDPRNAAPDGVAATLHFIPHDEVSVTPSLVSSKAGSQLHGTGRADDADSAKGER